MPRFGDQLELTLKKLGAPAGDTETLRLEGNQLADFAAQTAGWSGNSGMISSGAIPYPMDVIASHKTVVAEETIVFTVPNNYNHLRIVGDAIGMNSTAAPDSPGRIFMTFNNDNTSGAYPGLSISATSTGYFDDGTWVASSNGIWCGQLSGADSTSGPSSMGAFLDVNIANYTKTGQKTGALMTSCMHRVGAANELIGNVIWWYYLGTGAIQSIQIKAVRQDGSSGNTFQPGTVISLLGYK